MKQNVWQLFPFPTLTADGPTNGSILQSHADCVDCPTRACLQDKVVPVGEPKQCRYGLTYARIDDERYVVGLTCNDLLTPTKRGAKRARQEAERRVKTQTIRTSVSQSRKLGIGAVNDYDLATRELLARLEHDPKMHESLAKQLRQDFSDNLSQSHDFLQLVKLVRGHAESLLHEKFPDLPPTEAADKLPTEGAIFYSTELMLAKMDSMEFLNEINRAHGHESRFQLHPMVIKYLRIYNWQANEKELKIAVDGACFANCFYNSKAIGAVIQGLLDNLVKYAPGNSRATVTFEQDEDEVRLTFGSLGPRIEPSERGRIFLPSFRAKAAREIEISGLGVGLATAKQLSNALDLRLSVEQEPEEDRRFADRYWTTFKLRFEVVA